MAIAPARARSPGGPPADREAHATGPAERDRAFIWRVRHGAVCALLTGLALASDGGRLVADTKLDLVVDPVAFLLRGIHLWDPTGAAGQLQNQAYGYLFPMGPFFVAGHWLGIPGWAVQRLWWALVLCVAYTGVVALARRLGIGTPATGMLAGLAFALTPHLLTVLGPVSAEAWPMALSAWVLVPLVGAPGVGSARRAAFLSGLAVLCMGGVNAALDLAALVPALTWFATRRPGRDALRLAGWWLPAVLLACAWWLLPLALLGRYSPPFLDYIESASITTSTTSLVEVLRGTHDWIAYLPSSGWTAGFLLLTSGAVILSTVVVAAAGLVGLASRDTPHRTWLLATAAAGLVLLAMGHVGTVDGLGAAQLRHLLDGPLAPIRNVHKFDVALRLPLVLGLAVLVQRLSHGRSRTERRANAALAVSAAVFAVVGSGVPLVTMHEAPAGAVASLPAYWRDVARWLGQAGAGRALLVPGSRFAVYDWGTTNDEPLQALATSAWDVRNAIPLTNTGHIRWLDAIEQRLASGTGGAGLTEALRRSGVQYVVVRNDLDYGKVGATNPVRVHQALAQSPDIQRVVAFGPDLTSQGTRDLVYDQHLDIPYPAVEVFAVAGPGDRRVSTTPLSQVAAVTGGPEALPALGDAGLLAGRATVLAAGGARPGTAAVAGGATMLTDTPRRREVNFAGGSAGSATLTAQDPLRIDKPRRDYTLDPPADEAVALLTGARAVTASSSASDADVPGGPDQSAMPYSAVDGDPATAWRPNPGLPVAGQWLAVDFGREVLLRGTRLAFLPGSGIRSVTLSAGGRSARTRVAGADEVALTAPVPRAASIRVRLDARVDGADPDTPPGVAELTVPGVTVHRTVVLPAARGTTAPEVVALTTSGRRDACAFVGDRPLCATGQESAGEDAAGLDRTFSLPAGQSYAVSLTAAARPGPELSEELARAGAPPVAATGSSVAVPDPSGAAAAAVDGDLGTAWIADPADPDPTLTLQWDARRTISSLKLILDRYAAGTRPDAVTIASPEGDRVAAVGQDGTVRFAALTTDRIALHLRAATLKASFDPTVGRLAHLGLGLSEVLIPGVHDLATPAALQQTDRTVVTVPCGRGPRLVVDGTVHPTSVRATVRQLRRMQPVALGVCGAAAVDLGAGTHHVEVRSTSWWAPTAVTFTALATSWPPATGPPPDAATVAATPVRWGAVSRSVDVASRDEPTVLTVHENANRGWRAVADGVPLQPVTVDGWQQGYVLPPGPATRVVLTYTPDRWMGAGLTAGGVAALLVLAGALVPARRAARRAGRRHAPTGWRGAVLVPLAGVVALVLVGGTAGLGAAALAAALWAAGRRWRSLARVAPWLAGAAYLVAGSVLAVQHWGTAGYAAGAVPVQWLCLVAVALTFAGPPGREPDRRPGRQPAGVADPVGADPVGADPVGTDPVVADPVVADSTEAS